MFEKFNFTQRQIDSYARSAMRDLAIARASDIPEVVFRFSYDALLKISIAICAKNNLRAKSRQGHHVDLIGKASILLEYEDLDVIGQEMRSKRNKDLYGGGVPISHKEAQETLEWTNNVFVRASKYLHGKVAMF